MVKHVVASAAEMPVGLIKIAQVKGREIGLFNLGGAYFALLNGCPHAGAPLCVDRLSDWQPQMNPAHTGSTSPVR